MAADEIRRPCVAPMRASPWPRIGKSTNEASTFGEFCDGEWGGEVFRGEGSSPGAPSSGIQRRKSCVPGLIREIWWSQKPSYFIREVHLMAEGASADRREDPNSESSRGCALMFRNIESSDAIQSSPSASHQSLR